MKTVLICVICAGVAFGAMQMHLQFQAGAFGPTGGAGAAEGGEQAAKPESPPTKFPEDLAPVCLGQAAPRAAAWDAAQRPVPRCAILDRQGRLHSWHERLEHDWQADTVEETDLVLVLDKQQRTFIQQINYPGGAPPIRRYQYDLNAWLVRARSGQALAARVFRSFPREVRPVETWSRTEIGTPVQWGEVIRWVRDQVHEELQKTTTVVAE